MMFKNAKTRRRAVYALLFILLLAVEIGIALFVHDRFIRPYMGDVLVIVLLCCAARVAMPDKPRFLGLYMTAAGAAAEGLQALRLAERLGVQHTVLGVILGSTFDWRDLLCYAAGGVLFTLCELLLRRRKK